MDAGESAFWQFSLRFYRRAQVAPACITLQDELGVDVNVLFYLLYLAVNQRSLTAEEVRRIDASIRAWRLTIVHPLRAIRRDLKSGITPVELADSEALRSAIKRDELHAERLQQETLEREFPLSTTGTQAALQVAAAANLAAYSTAINAMNRNNASGGLPESVVQTLLSALAAEFGNPQQTVK